MGDYNGYNSGEKETRYLLPISSVFQKMFSQSEEKSSFLKRVNILICMPDELQTFYAGEETSQIVFVLPVPKP